MSSAMDLKRWMAWPAPNYVNPAERGIGLLVICSLMAGIATIVICLRLYARLFHVYSPKWDDWCMVLAYFLLLGHAIFTLVCVYAFSGRVHVWDMPPAHALKNGISGWVAELLYFCGSTAIRASILLFYRRIYNNLRFKYVVDALQILNVMYLIGIVLVLFLQCK
jgi:hypothetical protein